LVTGRVTRLVAFVALVVVVDLAEVVALLGATRFAAFLTMVIVPIFCVGVFIGVYKYLGLKGFHSFCFSINDKSL
jgi:hypothetical protein